MVLELVKVQLDYCQKNKLIVTNKVIGPEYVKKIRFLSGVNMKILLTIWYQEYLEAITDIEEEIIKVRKEIIY